MFCSSTRKPMLHQINKYCHHFFVNLAVKFHVLKHLTAALLQVIGMKAFIQMQIFVVSFHFQVKKRTANDMPITVTK